MSASPPETALVGSVWVLTESGWLEYIAKPMEPKRLWPSLDSWWRVLLNEPPPDPQWVVNPDIAPIGKIRWLA